MRTDRELLELALAVMPRVGGASQKTVIDEINARLTMPEDEPVAWLHTDKSVDMLPLYLHPHQPVRLSDVEVSELMNNVTGLTTYKKFRLFAEKIMDAMLEKNQ